jgi:hypothetical protein
MTNISERRIARRNDAFADFRLVTVDLRGIDVAEAFLQRSRNRSQHFRAAHPIGTVPDRRYFGAVSKNGMLSVLSESRDDWRVHRSREPARSG